MSHIHVNSVIKVWRTRPDQHLAGYLGQYLNLLHAVW